MRQGLARDSFEGYENWMCYISHISVGSNRIGLGAEFGITR